LDQGEKPEVAGEDARGGRQLVNRPQKITLGRMRGMGVRGLLVYCSDYHCSHSVAIGADGWPDHLRLSDLEAAVRVSGLRHTS
jgi:hypothetical protein